MNNKIFFSEQQKFRQLWIWILLIIIICVSILPMLRGVIRQLFFEIPFGNNPTSNSGIILMFIFHLVVAVGLIILFFSIKLDTEITTEEVKIRFFPFHFSFKKYKWENISHAEVKKYSPLQYGGWGIRKGFLNSSTAYNISGNIGLFLELKNGKKVIVGTKKMYEMEKALKKIEQQRTLTN